MALCTFVLIIIFFLRKILIFFIKINLFTLLKNYFFLTYFIIFKHKIKNKTLNCLSLEDLKLLLKKSFYDLKINK